MTTQEVKKRLEYLRGEIKAERISYGEIAELQSLAEYIEPDDVELLQWAGVAENEQEKTDQKLLDSMPFHHFKTAADFQQFLQTKYKKDETIDYVDIDGILFTMDEYDLNGQTMTYYNKRLDLAFEVSTSNRYQNGFSDAQVSEIYNRGSWRNDINYAD